MFFEHIWQDLRHGVRVFAKNPGFTAIAVISIAFGTGANVAIFSAADALLLRPLPVTRPGSLLSVGSKERWGLAVANVASYPDSRDLRDGSRSFDGLVAFTSRPVAFVVRPGITPQVRTLTMVSGNFFRVLGVEPVIGRGFRDDEDAVEGRDAVAVLGYGVWKEQFGADASVLGGRIRIAGVDFRIVGVVPERFTGLDSRANRDAAFVPLAMWPRLNGSEPHPLDRRDFRAISVKGRLKPGVTLAAARAELSALGSALERAYPETNNGRVLTAETELEARYERQPLDSALVLVLTLLSVSVLSVACANVAGLLSSRAPVRAREIALRLAIGAGRARIVRQLVTESLGIALAGGAGGLAVGYVGILLLRQWQSRPRCAPYPS